MKKINALLLPIFLGYSTLCTTACSSTRQTNDDVERALYLCKALLEPDAEMAGGEARFWFLSERADASRKLWNDHGMKAIDARLSKATAEIDRECLERLKQEGIDRQIKRD